MDNLKDFKNEALVVTNASDGNTPHIVQGIEPDGSLRTKPLAQAKPSETFLHIDRNESVIGTFFSNMNRQYDRPSDFRFYHLPVEMLSAAKELVEIFKFPKENEQLLSSYAIDIRQPVQEQSITGDTPQQTTRWGVDEVDWQQLARMGVTPESLGETGMQRLLNDHESAILDIRISFEGIDFETPACIRLVGSAGGKPVLNVECCKRYPELDRPYMGTELSPEVKENLSRSNNAGCVVELELAGGVREPCLLSLNPKTNRLHHVPVSEITIPQEVNRVRLSDDQTTRLARGESVLVENMWSEKKQGYYDARLQYNVCKGGFTYDFRGLNRKQAQSEKQTRSRELVIPQVLKGVGLTPEIREKLAAGKTVHIKNMTDNEGNLFSAFVRVNHERAKFDFFKWNPDKSKKQGQSQQAAVRQEGTKPANAVSRNRPVQKTDKKGVSI